MLIAVVSAKGSPGVSVSALAWTLRWRGPALLAECDPRGGEYIVGYAHSQAGQGRDLLAVHMASRRGASMDVAVREHVLQLAEDRWLLPGVPEPQQAAAVDWARLGRAYANLPGIDVIADCGAITAAGAPRQVWAAADLVVLMLRATAPAVRAAQLAIPRLRSDLSELGMGAERLSAVVIGAGQPYSAGEVMAALNPKGGLEPVPLVSELPLDPRVAGYLSSGVKAFGNREFQGSKFASRAHKSAAQIAERAEALRQKTKEINAFGAAHLPQVAAGQRRGGDS